MAYIIMFAFSVLMLYISDRYKENKIIRIGAFILAGLSFFVVSAFRYDVGKDYISRYANDYIKLGKGIHVENLELGYKLLVRICLFFSKDYAIIFVVTSAIIIGLTFYTIYKESHYPAISVAIYFLTGFFFHSLNLMREYIAISIVLFSYRYLVDKKYICYAILTIIAFLFHSSSIVMIVAIFLCDREVFNLKRTLIISVVLFIFGKYLWQYIGTYIINYTRFSTYIGSQFDVSFLRKFDIIFNLVLYLAIYYLYKNSKEIGRKDRFFVNMQACSVFFMIAATAMYLFFRISFYFGIFCIISIPYFLNKADLSRKKKIIILSIIMLVLTTNIVRRNVFGNTDEVSPYKTIFTVEDRIKPE